MDEKTIREALRQGATRRRNRLNLERWESKMWLRDGRSYADLRNADLRKRWFSLLRRRQLARTWIWRRANPWAGPHVRVYG